MQQKFSDKIKEEIGWTREIPIKFPNEVYKEFRQYAKEEAGECFWLAVKKLLQERDYSLKYDKVIKRLDQIENYLTEEDSTEDKKEIPSFGRKVN